MTLVDTSIWIDWQRGYDAPTCQVLDALLDDGEAALCPVVVQELLQGTVDAEHLAALRRRLVRLPMLMPADAVWLHSEAGALYARCRWAGITPRSPHDCLIATTAMAAGVPLLHDDADFVRMAEVEPRIRLVVA